MWSRMPTGDEVGKNVGCVDIDRGAFYGGRAARAQISTMTYIFKQNSSQCGQNVVEFSYCCC